MNWKMFITAFATIFLAELGDKTQLAILLYSSRCSKPVIVFTASALALMMSSAIAVILGAGMAKIIPANIISRIAGGGFIVIGCLLLIGKF